ncbi:hypothetical protein RFI_11927 [Reticulomyxa filosa]|uniref:Calmodulin n=1 Tax=Reticulomyxa filosa TaxID=46433 RepID=X6NIN3_RETFI|nr:hypothetical protein RFI_11927 [Reticulomyxa filosa]|eukprot:ETO25207.1 hypothetical protein RFI_11927 [Reticulomyxa filosa]
MAQAQQSFFDPERVDELRTAFNLKAQDGKLPTQEIGNLMRSMGLDPSIKETIECESKADPKLTGKIEFEAFLQVLKDRCDVPFSDDKLDKGFRLLLNPSKKLTVKELVHYMRAYNADECTDNALEEFEKKLPVSGVNVNIDASFVFICCWCFVAYKRLIVFFWLDFVECIFADRWFAFVQSDMLQNSFKISSFAPFFLVTFLQNPLAKKNLFLKYNSKFYIFFFRHNVKGKNSIKVPINKSCYVQIV